jgi:hypothetical protein
LNLRGFNLLVDAPLTWLHAWEQMRSEEKGEKQARPFVFLHLSVFARGPMSAINCDEESLISTQQKSVLEYAPPENAD